MKRLFFILLLIWPLASAQAVFVEQRLDDPELETRAIQLSKEFRCLVCQNQSIADSNAGLARDLRQIIRERITAGDTDPQIRQYLVDRYGDWVLMEPPKKIGTLLLWIGPALFLLVGAVVVFVISRRRVQVDPSRTAELSDEEQQQLKELLDSEPEDKS